MSADAEIESLRSIYSAHKLQHSILKIDFDSKDKKKYVKLFERIKWVGKYYRLKGFIEVYESRKGFHFKFIVMNKKLSDREICFIQTAMGDDYKRACLNRRRIRKGEKNWNVLFTKKNNFEVKYLTSYLFDVENLQDFKAQLWA